MQKRIEALPPTTEDIFEDDGIPSTEYFDRLTKNTRKTFSMANKKREIQTMLSLPIIKEIELSFGRFDQDRFIPSISPLSFQTLLTLFRKGYTGKTTGFKPLAFSTHTIVSLGEKGKRKIVYMTETGLVDSVVYERKTRYYRSAIRDVEWGYSLYESHEEKLHDADDEEFTNKPTREKWTYVSETKSFVIHLSFITFSQPFSNEMPKLFYELEVERVNVKASFEELEEITSVILAALNGWYATLPSQSEKMSVVTRFNRLFPEKFRAGKHDGLVGGWWDKPIDLDAKSLLVKEPLAASIKYDGTRRFLYFDKEGVYMLFPPFDMIKIAEPIVGLSDTLLDGEYMVAEDQVNGHYYAFDLLFLKGKDIRKYDFVTRYNMLGDLIEEHKKVLPSINLKNFALEWDLYKNLNEALVSYEELERTMSDKSMADGLIIQSLGSYGKQRSYKWKPSRYMSIDFYLRERPILDDQDENITEYIPFVVDKKTLVEFKPQDQRFIIKVTNDRVHLTYHIVECLWNSDTNEFVLYRPRIDKQYPNNIEHATRMWQTIQNPIPSTTIEGKDNVVMRKYHNIVKKRLLDEYVKPGSNLVDIGSGRGGDLSKWDDMKLSEVIVVEPNQENVDILKERIEKNPLKNNVRLQIINLPFQETDIPTSDLKYTVASFFSLTFFYEDQDKLERFMDRIADIVKKDGYFIGISMNGKTVQEKLENDPKALDNENFQIKKVGDWKDDQVFGKTISLSLHDDTSMVKDQTEWLVDFQTLEYGLGERGFTLTRFENLKDEYILPAGSKLFNSLMSLFVFTRKVVPKIEKNKVIGKFKNSFGKLGVIKQNNSKEEILYMGNIQDTSSMISAIVLTFNKSYREINPKAIKIFMRKFRFIISKKFTESEFIKHGGKKKDWAKTKIALIDENKVFEISMLWALEETLGIHVIILNKEFGIIYQQPNLPKTTKYITLLKMDELDYYPITNAKKNFTMTLEQIDNLRG